jgi:hypothetical protein
MGALPFLRPQTAAPWADGSLADQAVGLEEKKARAALEDVPVQPSFFSW